MAAAPIILRKTPRLATSISSEPLDGCFRSSLNDCTGNADKISQPRVGSSRLTNASFVLTLVGFVICPVV